MIPKNNSLGTAVEPASLPQKVDFLIAGVGGQGALTAGDILAEVGIAGGYDVKKSEVHGFAQRGGIVECHVRWGQKVYSTLAEPGQVDVLLGLEVLESARWASFLRPGGLAIVSHRRIIPMTVTIGNSVYPQDEQVIEVLARVTDKVHFIDAVALAEDLGSARVSNTVLLGFLSNYIRLPVETWLQVIEKNVPPKYAKLNRQAFEAGRQIANRR